MKKKDSKINKKSYKIKRKRFLFVIIAIFIFSYLLHKKIYNRVGESQVNLESISYEALKMVSKTDINYLNFPSKDNDEIVSYLNSVPKLKFKAYVFKSLPRGWEPVGASMLNYNHEKVSVILYKKGDEKVFLFSLVDNPRFYVNNLKKDGNLNYAAYGSKNINLIVWKTNQRSVNILAGWQSIQSLIQLIKNTSF